MKRSLEERRSFLSLKPDIVPKAFAFLLFAYTCYNLFLSQYSVFKVFELKRATIDLNRRINHQKLENQKKEKLLEMVREYPEHFKEKFAREYMQMQRPDEYILILKE